MPALVSFIVNCIIVQSPSGSDTSFSEFGDLGTLLLGGFALAVVIGIALVFVRVRLHEKKPPPAQFISITNVEKRE